MACSSVGSSNRVVLIALAGNLGVAAVKFLAFAFTGSSAMLTEGIHSLADTADEVLLLIGQRRGARPPDPAHPLGHGMETYFWTFTVALMVFLAGGVASIWQGVQHILHPAPIERPWLSYLVLAASAVFEGVSFMAAYREFRRFMFGREVPLWQFLSLSKDPNLFATLLEDGAALAGLAVAALGVTGAAFLGAPWADGLASIVIGVLLACVAAFLANETRSLIAGEAAAPPVVEAIRRAISGDPRTASLDELVSLHLGPNSILVAAGVSLHPELKRPDVHRVVDELTQAVRQTDPRICRVFLKVTN